ncbi:diacylglycerol kinase [Paludisphaera mucosa]|uniref:Diacylglycerol kinase n=1 Tax=Paludisphaera mucosa TaxID=3030827 RepID=A0ABT6FFX5_9BACT|nr:diacylglycerol kinase [Paludisphaera mucosa]MDG3006298.1 diacylglycerol kinase [Paludisphaera mucosa]
MPDSKPRNPGRPNSPPPPPPLPTAPADEEPPRGRLPVPEFDEQRFQLQMDDAPGVASQADRRGTRGKLTAGFRGLKQAVRGDSSFYAHVYRGVLIAIIAGLLRVDLWGWCLLILGGSLVLLAELCHSAVDTLARAIGDPDEPRLTIAREIAAAGVLVVAFTSGAVTTVVLSTKLVELFGWP